MALLDRISDANRHFEGRDYYRYIVNGEAVGWIDTQILAELSPDLFIIRAQEKHVHSDFLVRDRADFEQRMEAFFRDYFAKHGLTGWRDERYGVRARFSQPPQFLTERATLSFLGVTGYGVHVNGYVEKPDGLYLWIAKRALTKPTSPGKLDQVVAGGVPDGISPRDNVIKECEEEASIPKAIAQRARPVSTISYHYDLPIGMRPDVMFNYDLRLPDDFVPVVNDGEVDSFQLIECRELLERIAETQEMKFNSALVVIDFAIRHAIITPEHPDYVELCSGMHSVKRRAVRAI